MTPFWERDGISLYCGDCRDVELDPETVDLLLTDPPYGMQYSGYGLTTQNANIRADGARQGMRVVRQALRSSEPSWRPDVHLLLMCHWESWPDFYDTIAPYAQIRNALIWYKNRGGMGDTATEYARDYEVILYAMRGRRPLAGKRPNAVIAGIPPCTATGRSHPTEKPVALMRALIARHCPPDGLVVDPFAGAGTTLIAARAERRRCVGIEIERRWCEVAAERLSQQRLDL